jgi:hypothetical protein
MSEATETEPEAGGQEAGSAEPVGPGARTAEPLDHALVEIAGDPPSGWRGMSLRSALSWAVMLGAAAAIIVVGIHHAHEVSETLREVSPVPVIAAALLHAVTLVFRSEAWRIGLRSVGADQLPAMTVHRANALAFLVGTVQGELSLPARVAALRKAEPQRAPTIAQTLMVDLPLALVEIAWLFAFAALWQPLLLLGTIVIAVALPVTSRLAPSRPPQSAMRGLMVVTDLAALTRLVLVMGAVVLISALRIWLILEAFHLDAGLTDVAAVVAAVTIIGVLPIGVGTGPAATIASLSTGAGAIATTAVALSAGLAISATSVMGVVVYAVIVWGLKLMPSSTPAPAP